MADGVSVRNLVPPNDPRIRLIEITGSLDIGQKRNFGCERAAGEIICHWDDDDYSAPGRIQDQISRLIESGNAVTGYRSMKFTDGTRWWLYRGVPQYALGTSLCYRRSWWEQYKFPAKQVGEDNHFVEIAAAAGQMISVDAGDLMYATIHGGNTSPRNLSGSSWTQIAA